VCDKEDTTLTFLCYDQTFMRRVLSVCQLEGGGWRTFVDKYMILMHGRVELCSSEFCGAGFRFSFRFVPVTPQSAHSSPLLEKKALLRNTDNLGKHILIAEDEKVNRVDMIRVPSLFDSPPFVSKIYATSFASVDKVQTNHMQQCNEKWELCFKAS